MEIGPANRYAGYAHQGVLVVGNVWDFVVLEPDVVLAMPLWVNVTRVEVVTLNSYQGLHTGTRLPARLGGYSSVRLVILVCRSDACYRAQ
jgi:hypothetical protein